MVKRTASAAWKGGLKDGKGRFSVGSGAFKDLPYSWNTRFGEEKGTNPEELVGAAHASCFSMALSGQLGDRGMTAESIETTATVSMDLVDGKRTVTEIHLDLAAKVPNADKAKFEEAVTAAKTGCPISRLLAPGTKITLTSRLL